MKAKTFRDHEEAIAFAHSCQQGGKSCALVIKPNFFIVCDRADVSSYRGANEHVEYFQPSDDA